MHPCPSPAKLQLGDCYAVSRWMILLKLLSGDLWHEDWPVKKHCKKLATSWKATLSEGEEALGYSCRTAMDITSNSSLFWLFEILKNRAKFLDGRGKVNAGNYSTYLSFIHASLITISHWTKFIVALLFWAVAVFLLDYHLTSDRKGRTTVAELRSSKFFHEIPGNSVRRNRWNQSHVNIFHRLKENLMSNFIWWDGAFHAAWLVGPPWVLVIHSSLKNMEPQQCHRIP